MTKRYNWTPEKVAYITRHYALTNTAKMCAHLQCNVGVLYCKASALGLKKDPAYYTAENGYCEKGMSVKNSEKTRFKKNHTPQNKGMKQADYMSPEKIALCSATRFKKGHRPANTKPLGYERTDKYGYILVKVAEPRTFRAKHRVVWEQHHGPIPSRHKVVFKDGNRKNFDIDNLELLSSADMMKERNSMYARYPEEIRQIIHLKSVLKRQINKHSKNDIDK